jgi:hypothetical protein
MYWDTRKGKRFEKTKGSNLLEATLRTCGRKSRARFVRILETFVLCSASPVGMMNQTTEIGYLLSKAKHGLI